MQARVAALRPISRGTHAKGVCARAKFEDVTAGRDRALAARLAKGIYAMPGIYPAIVRFANADPNVNSDFKADVRSLSFSVEFGPGGAALAAGLLDAERDHAPRQRRARISRVDERTHGVKSSQRRVVLTVAGQIGIRKNDGTGPTAGTPTSQALPAIALLEHRTVPSWIADVVKYSAAPSADNPARALQRNNPNALQDELIQHLNEDVKMSSFDFALQFLDSEQMTYWGRRRDAGFWIENASVEWRETQAAFHKVARLTLLSKSMLPQDVSASVYFDVTGNSTPDSTPLGSINRARWPAEMASRKARMGG